MDMTPDRWQRTIAYLRELFAPEDDHHRSIMPRAVAAGLPDIAVGPDAGKFLQMLVALAGGRLVVEVGTLAGYSTIWLARGLAQGGRIVSIDVSDKHLDVARREAAAAGVAERTSFRHGRAGDIMPKLLAELGAGSCDLILFDAQRSEYPALLPSAKQLLRPRGLLVADNALDARRWTPDPAPPGEPPDDMDTFNRLLAADKAFSSMIVPLGNGLLVAVRQ